MHLSSLTRLTRDKLSRFGKLKRHSGTETIPDVVSTPSQASSLTSKRRQSTPTSERPQSSSNKIDKAAAIAVAAAQGESSTTTIPLPTEVEDRQKQLTPVAEPPKTSTSSPPPSDTRPSPESPYSPAFTDGPPYPVLSLSPSTGETVKTNNTLTIAATTPPEEPPPASPVSSQRPPTIIRRQSLLPANQASLIRTLLEPENPTLPENSILHLHNASQAQQLPLETGMVNRKVWVKRRDGSPTGVTVQEEDLVDDLRDVILKKYANALGRHYDAPDLILRIVSRSRQNQDRILNPDEPVLRTIDDYYPGGQLAIEALIIDVPQPSGQRKTPRPSPGNHSFTYTYGGHSHDALVGAEGNDYFPPMPMSANSANQSTTNLNNSQLVLQQPSSISILTTGQIPSVPASPGTATARNRRPQLRGRMNTSSPTVLSGNTNSNTPNAHAIVLGPRHTRSRVGSDASNPNSSTTPLLSNPLPEDSSQVAVSTPPPTRVASPRPKPKKDKKPPQPPPAGLLDGTVPPINVLIVEDNIINLKLLEAFMKRLKVRWQSAMNGKEAVVKWRSGGFHLVLMDIQLPVMSGLEATKEIRRLEKVNGIGPFSSGHSTSDETLAIASEDDKLSSTILFKSPVIIVALTASSLQSDRHEALAAGCNDFLTKPVNFIWLERKVTEWGCMQALIDFDGWKKWKDYSQNEDKGSTIGSFAKGKRQGGRRGGGGGDGFRTGGPGTGGPSGQRGTPGGGSTPGEGGGGGGSNITNIKSLKAITTVG